MKKNIIIVTVFLCLCILGMFGEPWLREKQREKLIISGVPIKEVEITGSWIPDFLWAGRAWSITVNSEVPIRLKLDDWEGRIAPGQHLIYSDHDSTNTGKYGPRDFWGFPNEVKVELDNPPNKSGLEQPAPPATSP